MDELFGSEGRKSEESPLADRMRPQVLDDIIGQDHIVGPGRLLRRAIQADRLSSVIFYGPPGTGKTSLARVIANTTRSVFESLNAVLTGIKDIREVIDRADERRRLYGRRTILFVDEVHRWNKAQQDALLPWVENGTVILIGATTENPFFEVNRALVSRSRIFQLKSLDSDALTKTAWRSIKDTERGYGKWNVVFEKGALEHLVEVSGGDARSLLNALELAIETSPIKGFEHWPPPSSTEIYVSLEAAEESIQRRALLYDRDGDYHFDTISAFIKSVRGSDPDAALYWLAKMVRAGEDPSFIFRRMIILAMEDVGLADPEAITTVISCAEAFDRIGFPEGNFALSEACLRLATAPKSNTTMAFFDAIKEVEKEDAEIPGHLRDPNRDAESFGHGEGYIYPHAYRDHWAAQQYLPKPLRGRIFYTPSYSGFEGNIRDEVLRKREIQAAVILSDSSATGGATENEILTWSAAPKDRESSAKISIFKRLESGRSALLLSSRDHILGQCDIARHHRILIAQADDGLLLWECIRRTPEGLTAALVENINAKEALLKFSATLGVSELEQPLISVAKGDCLLTPPEAEEAFSCGVFDHILAREPWRKTRAESWEKAFDSFALSAAKLLAPSGDVSIMQSPPMLGERLSRVISGECGVSSLLTEKLAASEEGFFTQSSDKAGSWWTWNADDLVNSFEKAGFIVNLSILDNCEERFISKKDISLWFDTKNSAWGSFMASSLGENELQALRTSLEVRANEGPIPWKWKSILLKALHK